MHICPMLDHEFPLIHLRLQDGHLYSPKHLFFPWYGVNPSPFGLAWKINSHNLDQFVKQVQIEKFYV